MSDSKFSESQLLGHVHWVRGLARALVRDPHTAEDLAQTAMVAALERPPARLTESPRAWLRTVVRNAWSQHLRGEARRRQREQRVAEPPLTVPTLDLVERASRHRELVDAVMAIREPFRECVLLRYFEDVSPPGIGERLGIPTATVHTRLHRGLHSLRQLLDRRNDNRREAWLGAVAAIGWPHAAGMASGVVSITAVSSSDSLPTASFGASIMQLNAKTLLAAAAVVLVGVAAFTWRSVGSSAEADPELEQAQAEGGGGSGPSGGGGGEAAVEGSGRGARTRAMRTPRSIEAKRASEPRAQEMVTIAGRVVRPNGAGVPELSLRLGSDRSSEVGGSASAGSDEAMQADPTGRFELQLARHGGPRRIESADPEFTTMLVGVADPDSKLEPVVVVAPRAGVGGVVRDADGGGVIEGCRVDLRLPRGVWAPLRLDLEASSSREHVANTDAEGRFELPDAPGVRGRQLIVTHDGYAAVAIEVAERATGDVVVLLRRPEVQTVALTGQVVEPDGRPSRGARVSLGLESVRTDRNGMFELPLDTELDAIGATRLSAVKAGYLPATLELGAQRSGALAAASEAPRATDRAQWPAFVRLRLGGKPLEIRGRVLDDAGQPVEDAMVWIADPSPFGLVGRTPTQLEYVLRGRPAPSLRRMKNQNTNLSRSGLVPTDDSGQHRVGHADPAMFWQWVSTNVDGAFELNGLLPRDYTLRVLDPSTLQSVDQVGVAAGASGVDITVPSAAVHPRVAGRVVNRHGQGLAGVRVNVRRPVVGRKLAFSQHQVEIGRSLQAGATTTDADGRFVLRDVPKAGIWLDYGGAEIVSGSLALVDGFDPARVQIEVSARMRFRVQVRSPGLRDANQFDVFDGQGRRVQIMVIHAGSVSSTSSYELVDGRSEVVSVPDSAARLVLRRDDTELATIPLQWTPGVVQEITP